MLTKQTPCQTKRTPCQTKQALTEHPQQPRRQIRASEGKALCGISDFKSIRTSSGEMDDVSGCLSFCHERNDFICSIFLLTRVTSQRIRSSGWTHLIRRKHVIPHSLILSILEKPLLKSKPPTTAKDHKGLWLQFNLIPRSFNRSIDI